MNKKTLTLLLLASITLLSVAGVKVSKLTRTKSFASNDLFIVVTGSTTKVTRHIRAQDLAVGLGPWITNSGGGASSVTNAISVVRSNGTAISAAATSLDFIEGTNVTLRATNAAGVVTVQINASGGGSVDPTNAVLANIIGTGAITNLNASQFSGTTVTSIKSGSLQTNNLFYGDLTSVGDAFFQNVVRMSNNVIISGDLSLPNYVNVADTLDAVASKQHGSFILTNFIAMGITNIVSANGNTVITTNSGVLTLTTSSGGSLATNANQFGASVTLTIASGALLTNLQVRGIDPLGLTASRALSLNASGDITNGTTTAAELEFVNGVTSAIQTQLNGKQNGQTNSSQFGASTTLTIADRASLTNINVYGTGAVFSGHVTVSSNITAGSFIGSGTGVPILKLQTMMSADNAFAITVDTNYFGLTNTFNFTNLAVGQQMRVKSVSNGNPTWEVPQLVSGVQTNTTSVQADWTGAEMVHITNSLIANVVIIPTNMIAGRSLRIIAQASTQTYTLSVSNAAGTVVLYPFASTNGGSAYTVTNGQTVELDLLSLNGKIHAAMGRFQ